MSGIREKLLAAFQVEHREHLEAVRGMLRAHAGAGFDPAQFDFDEAHRRVHSLKGAARIVGLDMVEALSHRLETLMTLSQSGKVRLDRRVSDGIQRALDAIEDCTAQWEKSGPPREAEDALTQLSTFLAEGEGAGLKAPEPEPAAPQGEALHTEVLSSANTPPPRAALGNAETARINVESLDLVLKHARESLADHALQDEIGQRLRRLRAGMETFQHDLAARAARNAFAEGGGGAAGTSFNESLDQAREIIHLQSESAWRAKRQTLRMYADLSAMRIIPADTVFGGIRKIVRDLARVDGKVIQIDVAGLEIRADRVVLQGLKDPVMHLLRNAVGHGIETPQRRAAQGKPPSGLIAFRLSVERNRLTITVEDDGAGLDRDRIADEAKRRGMLAKDGSLPHGADALTKLLLSPGFSTEKRVTELSGRGIGLSVVDRAIGQLQGSFTLAPRAPQGTVATITVPLSIASSKLLLVRCRGQLYAIPLHWIERIERVPLQEVTTVQGRPTYAGPSQKDMIPLARLADLIADTEADPPEGDLSVVLIKSDRGLFGLVVESLGGMHDALIHDLDAALPLDLISGGLVLPDGAVCPVINPAALLAVAAERAPSWPLSTQPSEERPPHEILVVDDSITTRTLEKSILEARGFCVSLSVDGADAIEQLRQHPVDLVIADVEMPRMSGFELLHAMKSDRKLAGIPVVLVTSRSDEKDQRKGLALGAEAYIVKQRFDQRELLETIDQIL